MHHYEYNNRDDLSEKMNINLKKYNDTHTQLYIYISKIKSNFTFESRKMSENDILQTINQIKKTVQNMIIYRT